MPQNESRENAAQSKIKAPVETLGVGDVTILGIESSCDETAASVVRNGREILSSVVLSQIEVHQAFGGVVPEVASRAHTEMMTRVVEQALRDAGVTFSDLDAIAVTYGPGLIGALFVGVTTAKSLALATGLPLIGVHHLAGHMVASALSHGATPPYLVLIASGGHTDLIDVKASGEMVRLGKTRDDAAGEAFDKVARAMGLGYPGGPAISEAAQRGDPTRYAFPIAKLPDGPFDFSFSGLKSSVMLVLDKEKRAGIASSIPDLAASFQAAVVEALCAKTEAALMQTGQRTLVLAGGVAANEALRVALRARCDALRVNFVVPPVTLCTDNAAMIAAAGYDRYVRGMFDDLTLTGVATESIEAWYKAPATKRKKRGDRALFR